MIPVTFQLKVGGVRLQRQTELHAIPQIRTWVNLFPAEVANSSFLKSRVANHELDQFSKKTTVFLDDITGTEN